MKTKKETKEEIASLKDALSKELSSLPPQSGIESVIAKNEMSRAISDVNENKKKNKKEEIIKKPIKTGISSKLVGVGKMDLPIGKLYSIGKSENKEAMGASGAGQFSAPLFTTTKKEMEETWSEKYKNSIDCSNPKGFSQKAHCQGRKKNVSEEELKGGLSDEKTLTQIAQKHSYNDSTDSVSPEKITKMKMFLSKQLEKGIKVEMEHTKDKGKAKEIAMDHLFEDPKYYDKLKKIEGKKTETKEATGASSAGQYTTTAAWAKSTKKKDWRGKSKTQIPGGKFVQVKKKCKKFPYCNQGDIKALNIFENEMVKRVITKISEKHNISENVIKNIIYHEYQKMKSNK
jgi:hypothetical protein